MRRMMFTFLLLELTIGFAVAQTAASNSVNATDNVLVCGHVWDGRSQNLRGPAAIRIQAERIIESKSSPPLLRTS